MAWPAGPPPWLLAAGCLPQPSSGSLCQARCEQHTTFVYVHFLVPVGISGAELSGSAVRILRTPGHPHFLVWGGAQVTPSASSVAGCWAEQLGVQSPLLCSLPFCPAGEVSCVTLTWLGSTSPGHMLWKTTSEVLRSPGSGIALWRSCKWGGGGALVFTAPHSPNGPMTSQEGFNGGS